MTDEERTRQTLRVLELLDESIQAYRRGDKVGSDLAAKAACRLDVHVVSAVQGGILIGEIPNPERDPLAWADYLQAIRERLPHADDRPDQAPGATA
ncbi:hypothetical protein [Micromonospora thermarum]|uniref:Transcriptional regulator n=1 Tax=Micromonospora thermarum TaxID=2720024 RepID=A0ABX0ZCL0_9ACTN|nr:hypothetical protein [Micromonospora thermarum]NJP33713.1 hypothetical protein [Micromonospora thermarum]